MQEISKQKIHQKFELKNIEQGLLMMICKYLTIWILLLSVFNAFSYTQKDFETFNQTNHCTHCNLTRMDYSTKHNNAVVEDSYLTDCIFKYDEFKNSQFTKVNLVRSKILYSYFSNSIFNNVNLSYANLNQSYFEHSLFTNVNFEHAALPSVEFKNTHFTNVIFSYANLSDVNFKYSHFENVNFKGSDLSNANLIGTNITEQQLHDAKSYLCAILPDGSVYDENGNIKCNQSVSKLKG